MDLHSASQVGEVRESLSYAVEQVRRSPTWSWRRQSFVPSEQARRAKRVAGGPLALSGLVYAGLFAFASVPVAVWVCTGAVVVGIAFTIGHCLTVQRKANATGLG